MQAQNNTLSQRSYRTPKRILFFVPLFIFTAAVVEYWPIQDTLPWRSIEEAKRESQHTKKPMFIYFTIVGNESCRALERSYFQDPFIRRTLIDNYVLVKVVDKRSLETDSIRRTNRVFSYPCIVLEKASSKSTLGLMPKDKFKNHIIKAFLSVFANMVDYGSIIDSAKNNRKPILIVAVGADYEWYNAMIDVTSNPEVYRHLHEQYNIALLMKSVRDHHKHLEELQALYTIESCQIIILNIDATERGRFSMTSRLALYPTEFLEKVKHYETL